MRGILRTGLRHGAKKWFKLAVVIVLVVTVGAVAALLRPSSTQTMQSAQSTLIEAESMTL